MAKGKLFCWKLDEKPKNVWLKINDWKIAGTANISEEHQKHAVKYMTPVGRAAKISNDGKTNPNLTIFLFQIDCTWVIRSEEAKQIYIQFAEYELNVRMHSTLGPIGF